MKKLSKIIWNKPSNSHSIDGFSDKEIRRLHLINSELIPTINRAKTGSISAQYDLYKIFSSGKEVKKDLELASFYLLGAMNATGKHLGEKENNIQYLSLLIEYALLEKEIGNTKLMKEAFYDSILFMQKYIPFEEWDFSIFDIIKNNIN